MLIIGKSKDYTLIQIDDLIDTGEKMYCEDYSLYSIFRERGVWVDLVYRHTGSNKFYNNFDEECKEVELVIPCNTTIDKNNTMWKRYEIYQMKGGYYG